MNARQAAKLYKKQAERNKRDAEAWRRMMKAEALKTNCEKVETQTIRFFKYIPDEEIGIVPNETIKRSMAEEIGRAILDAGAVRFDWEDVPDMHCRRYMAALRVVEQRGAGYGNN